MQPGPELSYLLLVKPFIGPESCQPNPAKNCELTGSALISTCTSRIEVLARNGPHCLCSARVTSGPIFQSASRIGAGAELPESQIYPRPPCLTPVPGKLTGRAQTLLIAEPSNRGRQGVPSHLPFELATDLPVLVAAVGLDSRFSGHGIPSSRPCTSVT